MRIKIIILLTLLISNTFIGQDDFPILKGLYLGQKSPGITPEVFARGIISTAATEGGSSFSPDGKFYLFARARSSLDGILMMEQIDSVWTKPRLAPFSAGKYFFFTTNKTGNREIYWENAKIFKKLKQDGLK